MAPKQRSKRQRRRQHGCNVMEVYTSKLPRQQNGLVIPPCPKRIHKSGIESTKRTMARCYNTARPFPKRRNGPGSCVLEVHDLNHFNKRKSLRNRNATNFFIAGISTQLENDNEASIHHYDLDTTSPIQSKTKHQTTSTTTKRKRKVRVIPLCLRPKTKSKQPNSIQRKRKQPPTTTAMTTTPMQSPNRNRHMSRQDLQRVMMIELKDLLAMDHTHKNKEKDQEDNDREHEKQANKKSTDANKKNRVHKKPRKQQKNHEPQEESNSRATKKPSKKKRTIKKKNDPNLNQRNDETTKSDTREGPRVDKKKPRQTKNGTSHVTDSASRIKPKKQAKRHVNSKRVVVAVGSTANDTNRKQEVNNEQKLIIEETVDFPDNMDTTHDETENMTEGPLNRQNKKQPRQPLKLPPSSTTATAPLVQKKKKPRKRQKRIGPRWKACGACLACRHGTKCKTCQACLDGHSTCFQIQCLMPIPPKDDRTAAKAQVDGSVSSPTNHEESSFRVVDANLPQTGTAAKKSGTKRVSLALVGKWAALDNDDSKDQAAAHDGLSDLELFQDMSDVEPDQKDVEYWNKRQDSRRAFLQEDSRVASLQEGAQPPRLADDNPVFQNAGGKDGSDREKSSMAPTDPEYCITDSERNNKTVSHKGNTNASPVQQVQQQATIDSSDRRPSSVAAPPDPETCNAGDESNSKTVSQQGIPNASPAQEAQPQAAMAVAVPNSESRDDTSDSLAKAQDTTESVAQIARRLHLEERMRLEDLASDGDNSSSDGSFDDLMDIPPPPADFFAL